MTTTRLCPCGRSLQAGRSGSMTGARTRRCLLCQTEELLRNFRYPAARRELRKGKTHAEG